MLTYNQERLDALSRKEGGQAQNTANQPGLTNQPSQGGSNAANTPGNGVPIRRY